MRDTPTVFYDVAMIRYVNRPVMMLMCDLITVHSSQFSTKAPRALLHQPVD